MLMPFVDTDRLQSVRKYADDYLKRSGEKGVNVGYVYQLIKEGKLETVKIDGLVFVVLPTEASSTPKP